MSRANLYVENDIFHEFVKRAQCNGLSLAVA